ncbi:MAG: 2'-5' RNA ligase family protein [Treponema sp.]|nr:2'-5' RNA ligase family protein [Treponema sp.]
MAKKEEAALTYAVTLYFDDESSGEIRALTKELCEVTGNDYMIQNDVPPHLTLGIFHADKSDFEKLKKVFSGFARAALESFSAGSWPEINFTGFDSFLDKVIFIKPQKSDLLVNLNSLLHDFFLPHFEAGDNRNYLPENWYPHIALGVKLTHEQFEKGMEFLKGPPASLDAQGIGGVPKALRSNGGKSRNPAKPGLPQGRCARIGLASCNPYTPIYEIVI